MSFPAVKGIVGYTFGFDQDVQRANAAAATAQQETSDTKAELAALKEQQAVKDAAAKVEADARAAEVLKAEEQRKSVEAKVASYIPRLEACIALVKAGGSMDLLASAVNEVDALMSGYGFSIRFSNIKLHQVMGEAEEMIRRKAQADAAADVAAYVTAKAKYRDAEIEEFRKKYDDAIKSYRGDLSLKGLGVFLTLGIPMLFENVGGEDRKIIRGLELALDHFNELVKNESQSPEEAFKIATEKHSWIKL